MIKIYGKNCINECIRRKAKIEKIFLLDTVAKKDNKFILLLQDRHIPYEIVAKGKMDSIFGSNHQGYGAYREDYKLYDESIIDELYGEGMRVVILDGIVDPHNLGAILRSVDAFAYDAVILPKNRSANITETVAHVSTGAIEHVKIAYVNSTLSMSGSVRRYRLNRSQSARRNFTQRRHLIKNRRLNSR